MQKPPPNFLIVMTDHQRGDTVLPEHSAVTPNLSKMVAEGVAFTKAFCPSPHCCPARATFFTGQYPSRHGVWNNICNDQALSRNVKPSATFWSRDLRDAGYDLHFSGKWHVSLDVRPVDVGWNEHFVSATSATEHGISWDRYQKISHPQSTTRNDGEILRPGYTSPYRFYGTREISNPHADHDEKTLALAHDALAKTSAKNPWAMYVGLIGPHDPYYVPSQFLDLYDPDEIPLPVSYNDSLADKPRIYQRMRNVFGQLSPREVKEAIRHFWAYCSYLDHRFGQLLAALDATGQAENTVVIYCSDHGDYAGEHGLFAKGIPCFRGAYHVPAVVRWPGGLRSAGRRESAFVSLADVGPTLLEAAGLSVDSARFTGQSLVPFLRDQQPSSWRDDIHTQCNGVELYYTQRSVSTARYKYVFNGFDFDELYDLQNDPHEMRNLAELSAYQSVKHHMCQRLWKFAYQQGDTAINAYITTALAPQGPASAFWPAMVLSQNS